jgi:hypothetical protein
MPFPRANRSVVPASGCIRQYVRVPQVESAVAYDGLPISSGGAHALGRISPARALTAWQDFLAGCTQPSPVSCWFDLPMTPELTVESAVVARIAAVFPDRTRDRFPVPLDRIGQAVDLLESIEPQPTNQWGMAPVWLWFRADFHLLRPDGSGVWPGQDPARFGHFQTPAGVTLGASSTRLVLQARRSLGLTLSIPEASDEDLRRVVPWLQSHLPMRLSSKQWTRWTLAKNGRTYRGRKIEPS